MSPRSSGLESVGRFAKSSNSSSVYGSSSSNWTSLTVALASGSVLMIGFIGCCTAVLAWVPACVAPRVHDLVCTGVALLGPFTKCTVLLGGVLALGGFDVAGWVLDPHRVVTHPGCTSPCSYSKDLGCRWEPFTLVLHHHWYWPHAPPHQLVALWLT